MTSNSSIKQVNQLYICYMVLLINHMSVLHWSVSGHIRI